MSEKMITALVGAGLFVWTVGCVCFGQWMQYIATNRRAHNVAASRQDLIKQGRAMRQFEHGDEWKQLCPKEVNCAECEHLRPIIEAWDAAKQKAMEGL